VKSLKSIVVLMLISFISAWYLHGFHRQVDHVRLYEKTSTNRYFLPAPAALHAASLGYHHAVGEVLWVRSILLYSDFVINCDEEQSKWLLTMLRAVSALDPEWRTVYYWGGTMLSLCGDIDGSDELFKAGAEALPDDAFFPFSISMNASSERGDIESALYWMRIAASKPNSPPWYKAAVAGLMSDDQGRTSSIMYLREMLENPNLEPVVRDLTEYRLSLFLHEEGVALIKEMRSAWEDKNGKKLSDLNQLAGLPDDPLNAGWMITPDGDIRSFVIEKQESLRLKEHELSLLKRKDW
jgi:hypothetical protein